MFEVILIAGDETRLQQPCEKWPSAPAALSGAVHVRRARLHALAQRADLVCGAGRDAFVSSAAAAVVASRQKSAASPRCA